MLLLERAAPCDGLCLLRLPGGQETACYSSCSRRASKSDEYRLARNSSSVCVVSLVKTCWTTPISASLWKGRSTCSGVTRLIEIRKQAGQRTARPIDPSG